ncbi:MAG: YceI family protein [Aureispira sp.]
MKYLLILLLGLPFGVIAQYEGIYDLPLPEKFTDLKKGIEIYSTPNPNYAEYEDANERAIVWKHATVIKATEAITIKETGAYLLHNGTWQLRASFNARKTKEMFDTKRLKLQQGDSVVFKENWRYGTVTQTGWNFWYVIGKTASGELYYGYEILETKGSLENGTQILPLKQKDSQLSWSGKAGDSDYTLTGTLTDFTGRLVIQQDELEKCFLKINMDALQHEIPSLVNHLKNKDFFDVKQYPEASFQSTNIESIGEHTYKVEGEFCLKGICNTEVFEIKLAVDEKAYTVQFEGAVDRTQYGVLYASSKQPDKQYSIEDTIRFSGTFSFVKDYPGSMPWNTLK